MRYVANISGILKPRRLLGSIPGVAFSLISCIVVLGTLTNHANAGIIFSDDYSSDSLANYDAAQQPDRPNAQHTSQWAVDAANGVLTYSRTSTLGLPGDWCTADLLVKSEVANTAGLAQFTVSGQFNGGLRDSQSGLVISGDNTLGGYEFQYYRGGGGGLFYLLRMTGDQMLGDEGGGTRFFASPTPLASYQDPLPYYNPDRDSYQVTATLDRSGAHPAITLTLLDLDTGLYLADHDQIVDQAEPANYGGNQFGWRVRTQQDYLPPFSLDNLTVTPEPSGSLLGALAALGLLWRRRVRK